MKNRQQGFTLIEVLVALIILGISMGAIFQSLTVSRRISVKADETLTAVRLAQNILADPALIDTAVRGRAVAAPIEEEQGWRYTLSAQPLEISTVNSRDAFQIPGMFELTVCLLHETDVHQKSYCMKQWYRP